MALIIFTRKNKLFLSIFILSITAALLLVWFNEPEYSEYQPIYFDSTAGSLEDSFIVGESDLSIKDLERVVFVFNYYDIEFKWDRNKLLVHRKYWRDKEFIWNMTTKANDLEWLESNNFSETR